MGTGRKDHAPRPQNYADSYSQLPPHAKLKTGPSWRVSEFRCNPLVDDMREAALCLYKCSRVWRQHARRQTRQRPCAIHTSIHMIRPAPSIQRPYRITRMSTNHPARLFGPKQCTGNSRHRAHGWNIDGSTLA